MWRHLGPCSALALALPGLVGCDDEATPRQTDDTGISDTLTADAAPDTADADAAPDTAADTSGDTAEVAPDTSATEVSTGPDGDLAWTRCTIEGAQNLGAGTVRVFATQNGDVIVQTGTGDPADDPSGGPASKALIRYRPSGSEGCELTRVADWGVGGEAALGVRGVVALDGADVAYAVGEGQIVRLAGGVEVGRCTLSGADTYDGATVAVSLDGKTAVWSYSGIKRDRTFDYFARVDTTTCAVAYEGTELLGAYVKVIGDTIFASPFVYEYGYLWGFDFGGKQVWTSNSVYWEGEPNSLWQVRGVSSCAGHPCALQQDGTIVQFDREDGTHLRRVPRAGGPAVAVQGFDISPTGAAWILQADTSSSTRAFILSRASWGP